MLASKKYEPASFAGKFLVEIPSGANRYPTQKSHVLVCRIGGPEGGLLYYDFCIHAGLGTGSCCRRGS